MRTILARLIYAYALSPLTKSLGEDMTTRTVPPHGAWEACDQCGYTTRAHWCLYKGTQHLHFCNHHHNQITKRESTPKGEWVWYPLTADALTHLFSTKDTK